MSERIYVDRPTLKHFIETMRKTADEMAGARDHATPAFTGNYRDPDGTTRWEGGVKVTLGVVNHDHPGRDAGSVLANRITNTVNYLLSIEEGSRAMAIAAEAVLEALDKQDMIAADELASIVDPTEFPLQGAGIAYEGAKEA